MNANDLALRVGRVLTPVPGDPPHGMDDLRLLIADLATDCARLNGTCSKHPASEFVSICFDCVAAERERDTKLNLEDVCYSALYRHALLEVAPNLAAAIDATRGSA